MNLTALGSHSIKAGWEPLGACVEEVFTLKRSLPGVSDGEHVQNVQTIGCSQQFLV